MRKINLFLKRIMDILGSTVGLILLAIPFLIIAIKIKRDSPGPVFFKQERLGKDGVPFYIIKFRTMVVNAEHIGTGLKVKDDTDDRITRTGHFLRKTSLDELPQLINVWKGDMSLVGPRPPVTYHPYDGFENYPDEMKKRFDMRPGMTGLAQVEVRNSVSWDERIVYDVRYVEQFSIVLDIQLLLKTVKKVLKSDSIYANQ